MALSYRAIGVLAAERRVSQSSDSVNKALERLSSGLRINRASDDAASLAIASSLAANQRVFTQGVRNLNDGISALNIADGAAGSLTDILIRLKELSTQAANGTFSTKQRIAIDKEGLALTNEYNRIIATTKFNQLTLLDGTLQGSSIQAGFGTDGQIGLTLGQELAKIAGTGSFQSSVSASAVTSAYADVADLNNDGKDDFAWADASTSGTVTIKLSNGDGTFTTSATFQPGQTLAKFKFADLNNDGKQDLVVLGYDSATTDNGVTFVLMGNGDGTFGAARSYLNAAGVESPRGLDIQDINGDGVLDIVTTNNIAAGSDYNFQTILGNGDGTFRSGSNIYIGTNSHANVVLGDFNEDGRVDLLAVGTGVLGTKLLLGDGAGNFSLSASNLGLYSRAAVADFNHDGHLDLALVRNSSTSGVVWLGNGDGTFTTSQSLVASGNYADMAVTDINGDGRPDIVTSQFGTAMGVFLSNGDGTFASWTSFAGGNLNTVADLRVGDFTGDGAKEALRIVGGLDYYEVWSPRTQQLSTLPEIFLSTRAGALSALTTVQDALDRVGKERGRIGATQSRFISALNTVRATSDNYAAARGTIENADVAAETANMVRSQILQKAGIAVLAQANLQPKLAISLLQ